MVGALASQDGVPLADAVLTFHARDNLACAW
jgi:hypothetical protein